MMYAYHSMSCFSREKSSIFCILDRPYSKNKWCDFTDLTRATFLTVSAYQYVRESRPCAQLYEMTWLLLFAFWYTDGGIIIDISVIFHFNLPRGTNLNASKTYENMRSKCEESVSCFSFVWLKNHTLTFYCRS